MIWYSMTTRAFNVLLRSLEMRPAVLIGLLIGYSMCVCVCVYSDSKLSYGFNKLNSAFVSGLQASRDFCVAPVLLWAFHTGGKRVS